jgi:hypothetical protein
MAGPNLLPMHLCTSRLRLSIATPDLPFVRDHARVKVVASRVALKREPGSREPEACSYRPALTDPDVWSPASGARPAPPITPSSRPMRANNANASSICSVLWAAE